MSSQHRYCTLISHIGKVYKSSEEERTDVLMAGLDAIVHTCKPVTPSQWDIVRADSDRLCKVWSLKESQTPLADAVVLQVMDILNELSSGPRTNPNTIHYNENEKLVTVKEPVKLTVEEQMMLLARKNPNPYYIPVSVPAVPAVPARVKKETEKETDKEKQPANTIRLDIKEIEIEPTSFILGTQIVETSKYLSEHASKEPEPEAEAEPELEEEEEETVDVDVEEAEAEETEAEEVEPELEETEEAEEETEEAEEEVEETVLKPEPKPSAEKTDTKPVEDEEQEQEEQEEQENEGEEQEDEAEDETEEDEEEMGMVTIRGRKYWLTSVSKKLYEVTADEEIGKEVGVLENGRPKFLA
jgi:hypothetical protein